MAKLARSTGSLESKEPKAKQPLFVYVVVYSVIALMVLGLLTLLFTAPTTPGS